MKIQPYLFFHGQCEEALAFYRKTLGAEVSMLMRYKESPDPLPPGTMPPGYDDKIMHANLHIGESVIMVSDGHAPGQHGFRGFSLAVSVADGAQADQVFAELGDGGQVQMPLTRTFWSPRFGMLIDRFGIAWMVGVEPDADADAEHEHESESESAST